MNKSCIAIHGGAGTILPHQLTPQIKTAYQDALKTALAVGDAILKKEGFALDAVHAAVSALEDCELFNAGKGSVFNAEGFQEMDASIMCGKTLEAGAVCGVKNVKNPVDLAIKILRYSHHVLLSGAGAAEFGRNQNVIFKSDDYFYSEKRFQQWQKVKGTDHSFLDHNIEMDEKKFGTVGAVALDVYGNNAAATSTGGMTNKKYGRVGDSPLIGIGNYANNETCAVSCTGEGEYFIRGVLAYDISAIMEYRGDTLIEACQSVVHGRLSRIGGEGGVIAVDQVGNISMEFNSAGMYRAARLINGEVVVKIFKDE